MSDVLLLAFGHRPDVPERDRAINASRKMTVMRTGAELSVDRLRSPPWRAPSKRPPIASTSARLAACRTDEEERVARAECGQPMGLASLEAFRAGEEAALTRVYVEYADELRRTLARHGGLSREDVSDLLQDVFVHAFSAPVRALYDGSRPFRPFLHAIARSVLVDWLRRRKREPGDALDPLDPTEALGRVAVEPRLTPLLIDAGAYLNALPPEFRKVYVERFVYSRTQREAALALGISRQALRTIERQLLDGLRKRLQTY